MSDLDQTEFDKAVAEEYGLGFTPAQFAAFKAGWESKSGGINPSPDFLAGRYARAKWDRINAAAANALRSQP